MLWHDIWINYTMVSEFSCCVVYWLQNTRATLVPARLRNAAESSLLEIPNPISGEGAFWLLVQQLDF